MGSIDLANGMLDNATGAFNLPLSVTLPSNGYQVNVDFNFEAMAPPGGSYYRRRHQHSIHQRYLV